MTAEEAPRPSGPDAEPESPRFKIEPIEAGLILFLLLLILSGNIAPAFLTNNPERSIAILHKEGNHSAPEASNEAPRIDLFNPKDLNKATREDLINLPGIGPSLADSILAYRERRKQFQSLEELDQVPGIGKQKLAQLAPLLFVAGVPVSASDSTPAPAEPPQIAAPSPATARKALLNLNTATQEELESLPNIGETFALRILEARKTVGKFTSWAQIEAIPGIGRKRLENIRECATIP